MRLKENEAANQRLGDIVERSLNEIYVFDTETLRYELVNKGARLNLGYDMLELQSMTPLDLKPEYTKESLAELVAPLRRGEKDLLEFETVHKRKNGSLYPVEVHLQLLPGSAKPVFVALILDITERKQGERQLHEERGLLRSLIDSIPDLIFCKNAEGVYLRCNTAFEEYFDAKEKAIVGRTDFDFVDAELARFFREQDALMMETGKPRTNEEWVTYPNGNRVFLETLKTPYFGPDGEVLGLIGISRDITTRKAAEEHLKLSAQVFEQSRDGIMITDAEINIISVNRAFTEITGYEEEEVRGQNPRILSSGRQDSDFYGQMWEQISQDGHWQGEIWNRRKNGEIYPQWLSISRVGGVSGQISHYIGIHTDITQHKEAEAHIEYLARYDALTDLPNRNLLQDRVEQSIAMAQRNSDQLALLFIDLDHFKNINDSLGHSVGDQLLVEIARRLKKTIREEDTVSRLGGDEFNVLLISTHADGASRVASKVISALSCPIPLGRNRLYITPSIGISLFPENGRDYETLSRNADTALYQAKQNGRNQYRFFTQEMQVNTLRRMELEHHLRRALERDELTLVYQPQMDIQTREIVGAEVLLRWQHPQWGAVSPAEFIPVAEDSGMILTIGDWVLEHAIAQGNEWWRKGLPPITLAVNLSLAQFREKTLFEKAKVLLKKYGYDARFLELELTESIAMQNAEAAIDITRQLGQLGIRLSIDDFGTGYSSLSYLKRFAIHKVKIDQSFVDAITSDPEDAAIVDAIISMSKSLGVETIAEGVETEEQFISLREKGCDQIQGYHFSKPLTPGKFSQLVEQHQMTGSRRAN